MYAYFRTHPWTVVPLNASEPALDLFLVLTGFLATAHLVPALEAASSPAPVIARCGRAPLRGDLRARGLRAAPAAKARQVPLRLCSVLLISS